MSGHFPIRTRQQTRTVVINLVQLPRRHFEIFRDRLVGEEHYLGDVLDVARDANLAVQYSRESLGAVHSAMNALHTAEQNLVHQQDRLTYSLETIVNHTHGHVPHLHAGTYHNLLDPQQLAAARAAIPANDINAHPPPVPAPPVPPQVPHLSNPPPRIAQMARRGRHFASRRSNTSSSSSRQSRQSQRSARITYPSTSQAPPPIASTSQVSPPVTSRSSSPGYVGPYEDFLEMQKDKYGVDSDGEIRVVDRWDGEEVEDPMAGEGSPDDTEV